MNNIKPIRRMIYTNDMHVSEVLYSDIYKGFTYYIVSYGTHPCCYISLNNYLVPEDLKVHGGITWSGYLHDVNIHSDDIGIGWDYAHYGDRFGEYYQSGHTWKTTELIKECIGVIDEIIRGEEDGNK